MLRYRPDQPDRPYRPDMTRPDQIRPDQPALTWPKHAPPSGTPSSQAIPHNTSDSFSSSFTQCLDHSTRPIVRSFNHNFLPRTYLSQLRRSRDSPQFCVIQSLWLPCHLKSHISGHWIVFTLGLALRKQQSRNKLAIFATKVYQENSHGVSRRYLSNFRFDWWRWPPQIFIIAETYQRGRVMVKGSRLVDIND